MKSGKQRRAEIKRKRQQPMKERDSLANRSQPRRSPDRLIPVNEALLAPNNSYGVPDFVTRGFYVDMPFRCVDCSKEEVWTGSQQKWWYEVAKGFMYSSAIRCRACRRKKRERRQEVRQAHLEGILQKRNR